MLFLEDPLGVGDFFAVFVLDLCRVRGYLFLGVGLLRFELNPLKIVRDALKV
jgi:hypothetical protein